MKIVVDMNLPPSWGDYLTAHGWPTMHWSTVGDHNALDADIMSWALAEGFVVFTHDLDFGAILATTHAAGPSVVQLRTQELMPARLGPTVVDLLRRFQPELEQGSLIVLDAAKQRVRLLPF